MLLDESPPVFEKLYHYCSWFRCCSNNNYIIQTLHIFIIRTLFITTLYINHRKNRQPGKQPKKQLKPLYLNPMLLDESHAPVFEKLYHHCSWFRCCSNNNYIIQALHIFIIHTLFITILYINHRKNRQPGKKLKPLYLNTNVVR